MFSKHMFANWTKVNSYIISFEVFSVKTVIVLFICAWMLNRVRSHFFKLIIVTRWYLRAISIVWLMRSDCSPTWEWYAIEYNSCVSSWSKMIFHKLIKNFEFLFDMIVLSNSQFINSRRVSNVSAQFFAFHVNISSMREILFENLHVVNMIVSNFSEFACERASIKLIVIVWNETFEVKTDYKKSYDLCHRVWNIWHSKQWRRYSRNILIKSRIYQEAKMMS